MNDSDLIYPREFKFARNYIIFIERVDTDEFIIAWYVNGRFNDSKSYYTNDKKDAEDTFELMKQQVDMSNNTVQEKILPSKLNFKQLIAECLLEVLVENSSDKKKVSSPKFRKTWTDMKPISRIHGDGKQDKKPKYDRTKNQGWKKELSESDDESFYKDARDREDEWSEVRKELEAIKKAGLQNEYDQLMNGIFNLPIDEFDKRSAQLQKLVDKAFQISSNNSKTTPPIGESIKKQLNGLNFRRIVRECVAGVLIENLSSKEDPLYVEYSGPMANEAPFTIGDEKFEYCWAIYPGGRRDIGVYAYRGDVCYSYNAFRKRYNIEEKIEETEKLSEMTTTGAVAGYTGKNWVGNGKKGKYLAQKSMPGGKVS